MSTPVEEQLVVFGANDSHQLGLGEEDATEDVLVPRPRPAGMIGATVVAAMAFGSSHAVMLRRRCSGTDTLLGPSFGKGREAVPSSVAMRTITCSPASRAYAHVLQPAA